MEEIFFAQKTNKLHIGERIKMLRTAQKRTMHEIAKASELSKSMISKVENNKTVPSVAALVKIANTLGTNISSLLEQDGWVSAIVTIKEKALDNLTTTDKGYTIYPYASEYHQKKIQPFLFVARKGEVIPHELSHEGEEFIYVIKGQMRMKIGEMSYLLNSGDSLYFSTIQKHGIMPVSNEVMYLDIFV